MAGLETPVPSPAAARQGPPVTTSLGSVAVHRASPGLAVSRVGVGPSWGLRGGLPVPEAGPALTTCPFQPALLALLEKTVCSCAGVWARTRSATLPQGPVHVPLATTALAASNVSAALVSPSPLQGHWRVEGGMCGSHTRGRGGQSPALPSAAGLLPSGCPPGRYGPGCEQLCRCLNGGSCDTATGACRCPAGFLGADCSLGEWPAQGCGAPTAAPGCPPPLPFVTLFLGLAPG